MKKKCAFATPFRHRDMSVSNELFSRSAKIQFSALAIFAVLACVLLFSVSGCSASTLLIGKWQDKNGNVLEIKDDYTFESKIEVNGVVEELSGSWGWKEGTSAINFETEDGRVLLSLFEVNGGILNITWATDPTTSELLHLQKVE